MFKFLFLLFIVVPMVEIAILLQVSDVIGFGATLLLVVFTAYLGAKMVKQQGLSTLAQIQQKTATGQLPSEELFDGACILVSGVLLLTPGIITDLLGFSLLTPVIRKQIVAVLKKKVKLQAVATSHTRGFGFEYDGNTFDESTAAHRPADLTDGEGSNNVIDGEYTRKD